MLQLINEVLGKWLQPIHLFQIVYFTHDSCEIAPWKILYIGILFYSTYHQAKTQDVISSDV